MPRNRINLIVSLDLDATPGVTHTGTWAQDSVFWLLNNSMKRYNPTVSIVPSTDTPVYQDTAKIITKADLEAGGELFMRSEAPFGWWIVRSTDPKKQDLFLPPHIFRKCFRFVNVDIDYTDNFIPIEEI